MDYVGRVVVTDPSVNQSYYCVEPGCVYMFREDRIINPVSKETEVYEKLMVYDDYSYDQILDACMTFGYTINEIDGWISHGEEVALILECLFELSS